MEFTVRACEIPSWPADLHPGLELLFLLVLTLIYGTFQANIHYVIFFASSFLFCLSLLAAFTFFNPFSLEWRNVRSDIVGTVRWLCAAPQGVERQQARQQHNNGLVNGPADAPLAAPAAGRPSAVANQPLPSGSAVAAAAEKSWAIYYERHCEELDQLPFWSRAFLSLRLCRWVVLASALLYSAGIVRVSNNGVSQGVFLGAMFLVPAAFISGLQLLHVGAAAASSYFSKLAEQRDDISQTAAVCSRSCCTAVRVMLAAAFVAAIVLLIVFGSVKSTLDGGDVIEILMACIIMVRAFTSTHVPLQYYCLQQAHFVILLAL